MSKPKSASIKQKQQEKALVNAVYHGQLDAVLKLLKQGVDKDCSPVFHRITNKFGATPWSRGLKNDLPTTFVIQRVGTN
jgi:hypothetical protein